jgi:hypothetical protein
MRTVVVEQDPAQRGMSPWVRLLASPNVIAQRHGSVGCERATMLRCSLQDRGTRLRTGDPRLDARLPVMRRSVMSSRDVRRSEE